MNSFRTLAAASAFAAVASLAIGTAAQAASVAQQGGAYTTDVSAAKRYYHRRYVRHYYAPRYYAPRYSAYQRGSDPSLGPDGRPYQVPAYLRGLCYYDEGYGRFSACPNR